MAACTTIFGGAAIFAALAYAPHERIAPGYLHPQQAVEVPVATAATVHHYVAIVRGYFGYASALSDFDRANGLGSRPLTLVSYQGKRGEEYSFTVSDGGPYADVIVCDEPCDVAQSMGMGGNKAFRVQPGTVLGDVIEDARNGFLDLSPKTTQAPAAAYKEPSPTEPVAAVVQRHLPRKGIRASTPGV